MNIFNSLGSNYKLPRIFLSWLPNTTKLMVALKRDFNASDVSLTFKGRQALYLALKQLELKE